MRPGWIVAGILREAAGLVACSLLTRRVLAPRSLQFLRVLRIDLSTLGVGRVVPWAGPPPPLFACGC